MPRSSQRDDASCNSIVLMIESTCAGASAEQRNTASETAWTQPDIANGGGFRRGVDMRFRKLAHVPAAAAAAAAAPPAAAAAAEVPPAAAAAAADPAAAAAAAQMISALSGTGDRE